MGISDDFHHFIAKAGDLASSASEIGSQKMKDLEHTATGIKTRETLGGLTVLTKASREHLDNFEKSGIPEKLRNIATEKRSEIAERVREMEQSHLATKARERGLELARYGKQKLREFSPRELREAVLRRVHTLRSSVGKVFGNGRAAGAIWKLFREHPVREGGLVFLMIYPAFLWMPVLGILGWGTDGVNSGSFARKRQSEIGDVPRGSTFSALQSIGSGRNETPSDVMNFLVRACIVAQWAFRARRWISHATS